MTDTPGGWRGPVTVILTGAAAWAWMIGGHCVAGPLMVVLAVCYAHEYFYPVRKGDRQ